MIEGAMTKRLNFIPDERGRLMEILRRDEEIFGGFGQVYLTTTYPGVVKAWHFGKLQVDSSRASGGCPNSFSTTHERAR